MDEVLPTDSQLFQYQLKYPALPGLICNLLSILKMCSSAFRYSSTRGAGGEGAGGQTWTKTFLGQVGMCVQNFIKIGAEVWISLSPPHTNRQTDKHLYAHLDKLEPLK